MHRSRGWELFSPSAMNTPEPILSPQHIIAPIRWDVLEHIQEALPADPVPQGTPGDETYVPTAVRAQLLQWIHSCPSSGHPDLVTSCLYLRLSPCSWIPTSCLIPVYLLLIKTALCAWIYYGLLWLEGRFNPLSNNNKRRSSSSVTDSWSTCERTQDWAINTELFP
ncbi:PDZK1-interacting protein 1 isoform 1-T1 [Spinachia spinachia]